MAANDDPLTLEVRTREPERFLCALFAPRDRRPAILALILLHHELAGIAQRAKEPMPALIRFQWWRDSIDAAAAGRPPRHPLLASLARELVEGRLGVQPLVELVDGHEARLEAEPAADLAALEGAIRTTSGRLQVIWARVLGCADDAWLARAEAAGTSLGLTELARAWAVSATPPVVPMQGAAPGIETVAVGSPLGNRVRRGVIDGLLARSDRLRPMAAGRSPSREWLSALLPALVARSTSRRLRRARKLPIPAPALGAPLLPLSLTGAWLRARA